jgi:hypothetical protein
MAIIDQGKLLFHGTPSEGEKSLSGQVWQKSVSKTELIELQKQYQVISTKLVAGRPLVHILSSSNPGNGFSQVDADLEDVFFSTLQRVA